MKAVSLITMIRQLEGLLGTPDISDWEERFIGSVRGALPPMGQTTALSEKQVDKIEQLWTKHFAG